MDCSEFDPFGGGPAAEMKKTFLSYLQGTRYWSSDPVPASEVVIEAWRGRVDLALFNGHLHAFEIKSDADKLDRLPDQLQRMIRHFDHVGVVCGDRHLKKVQCIVDAVGSGRVGIYRIDAANTVRRVRASRAVDVKDSGVLASFLLREDIETAFAQAGVPFDKEEYAYILREKAAKLRPSVLRKVALNSLKSRYRDRGQRLLAALPKSALDGLH